MPLLRRQRVSQIRKYAVVEHLLDNWPRSVAETRQRLDQGERWRVSCDWRLPGSVLRDPLANACKRRPKKSFPSLLQVWVTRVHHFRHHCLDISLQESFYET